MKVPFVDWRSRTITALPSSRTVTSAWKLETLASGIRNSFVGFRPMVFRPLCSSCWSGWVSPLRI